MKIDQLLGLDTNLKLIKLDHQVSIEGITLPELPKNHQLCFLKDKKFADTLRQALADQKDVQPIVIMAEKLWSKLSEDEKNEWMQLCGVMTSQDVPLSMCRLSRPFYEKLYSEFNDLIDGRQMGDVDIHPTAEIAQNVFIASNVVIGANVKIHSGARILGKSIIGESSTIYPNVTIYHQVKIGARCRIHSGSVLGADGFGYHFDGKTHQKIWHMGGVEIGPDVEIGACSAVDQGTFAPTIIGANTKIDNHVQIGHNCRLGQGVVICGHVALGGSTTLGDFVVFGGKSGIGDGRVLGPGCQVAGGALVNADWPAGSVLGGHPARPLKEWMKGLAYVRKKSLEKS